MSKFVLLAVWLSSILSLRAEPSQPNIVFIMVDDLGFGDVGFNGSTYYETRAIDQLAESGVIFENAYMYPTCSPSRTAVATGKQSFRTGVYTVPVLEKGDDQENIFSRWTVGEEHVMYSQPLAESGYKCIHLGKWHLVGPFPEAEHNATFPITEKLTQPDPGDYSWVPYHNEHCRQFYPEGRGYLKNIGGTYRGDPALEIGGYQSDTKGYFAPFGNPFLPESDPEDKWLTDYLTTEAIDFMTEHKDGPFFVNLHYYTVHRPIVARSEDLLQKYIAKDGDPATGQGSQAGKRGIDEAAYATMIESLDDNVARIVDFLNGAGIRENTMIVFTSDNGHNVGINNTLRGKKGHIYEGGIRVPTFVNWPGHTNARRTDVAISGLDFFPTFMDLADITYEGQLDGESIRELLQQDSKRLSRRPLFWHVASCWKHGTCSVIRKDHLKLIQFLEDGRIELYNLRQDPMEARDLADENPEVAQTLLQELVDWRRSNHVPLPPNSSLEH